jgi:branched-chain amino acid transport system substrate-binding protein
MRCSTFALLLGLGATLTAFTPLRAAEYKVGLIMAMTGPYAFAGEPAAKGARLAADVLNAERFLGEDKIVLSAEDNGGDKAQALTLLNRFAHAGSLLVLGPTSTVEVTSVAGLANELKIPIFNHTFNMDVLKTGIWPFKITSSPLTSVTDIAQYTFEKLKAKKVGIVYIRENEGYVAQRNAFKDILTKRGVSVVADESILGSDTDFTALSTKLAGIELDAILVMTPAEIGANIISQAKQAGLKSSVRFIAGNSMASDAFIKAGGMAVEDVIVAADFVPGGINEMGRKFVADYVKKYGSEPDNWAAIGYSLMQLTAVAIKKAQPKPTRETVRAALAGLRNEPTMLGTGSFSFDEGRAPYYGIALLTIKSGKFVAAN